MGDQGLRRRAVLQRDRRDDDEATSQPRQNIRQSRRQRGNHQEKVINVPRMYPTGVRLLLQEGEIDRGKSGGNAGLHFRKDVQVTEGEGLREKMKTAIDSFREPS